MPIASLATALSLTLALVLLGPGEPAKAVHPLVVATPSSIVLM